MRTWFAKQDNSTTRRLREILEAHEATLDERFVEESEFHASRQDQHRLFQDDENKIDFWSSTGFHGETPRPAILQRAQANRPKKQFFAGDVVIFKDPIAWRVNHKRVECTGVVVESPCDSYLSLQRKDVNGEIVKHRTIRRGAGSSLVDGFYKVQVISDFIIPELQHAEPHQVKRIVEKHVVQKRKRKTGRKLERRIRYELLTAHNLEAPEENTKRKLTSTMEGWLLRYLRNGMAHWKERVREIKHEMLLQQMAITIQGFWRFCLAKRLSWEKRLALQMIREQEERELERQRQEAIAHQKQLAHEKFLRENGVTRDGVRYFLTMEELEAFYAKQKRMCEKLAAQMELLATGLKRHAFQDWKYYICHVLPPTHLDVDGISRDVQGLKDLLLGELQEMYQKTKETSVIDELGDLPVKLKQIADLQAKRERSKREESKWNDPWHPGLNIKLPALPDPGAKANSNGTLEITNLERFKNFKTFQTGPTDCSSWLIQGAYAKVLFGGYPIGQARKGNRRITTRSGSVASLLASGVDTFVCLLEPEECERMRKKHDRGWFYKDEVTFVCDEMRNELSIGLNACKEALAFAEARVKRGREVGYGRAQQEALERAEANRKQDYIRAQAFYENFSNTVNHVAFPMPKNGVFAQTQDDEKILNLCKELENRMRRNERLYIFSLGGSGRAGVIGAILLGRLYGLKPHDALERVQRSHDTQKRFNLAKKNSNGSIVASYPISCPRLIQQRQQVARLLEFSDPAYDSVVFRTESESKILTLRETAINRRGSQATAKPSN